MSQNAHFRRIVVRTDLLHLFLPVHSIVYIGSINAVTSLSSRRRPFTWSSWPPVNSFSSIGLQSNPVVKLESMCSEIVWNASSNMLAQQNGKDLVATQSVNRRLLMTKLDTGIGQDMKRVADFYFIIPESFLIAFLYIAFVFLKMKAANLKQTRSSVG